MCFFDLDQTVKFRFKNNSFAVLVSNADFEFVKPAAKYSAFNYF